MRKDKPTTYCLYCYAPIDRTSKAARHCPACDHVDIKVDHAIYWTREPALEIAERALKVFVVTLLIAVSVVLVPIFVEMKAIGPGAGWVIVLPLMAGTMLAWQTVSLITHKPSYSHVRLTWTLIFLLVPIAPILFGIAISISVEALEFEWLGWAGPAAAAITLPCLALGWLAWRSGDWFESWKQRRIADGAA